MEATARAPTGSRPGLLPPALEGRATFAWLLSNRRVVVRWKHHVGIYEKVLDAFARSNRELAADLDMDLKQYGYYIDPPAPHPK